MLRCEFKNPKIFSPRRSFPRTSLCLVAKVNKQTNQQTYKSTNKQINKQTNQQTDKDIWRRRSKYQTNKSMTRRRKTDKQWFPSHTTLCLVGWWGFEFLQTNHDDSKIRFIYIFSIYLSSAQTIHDDSEIRFIRIESIILVTAIRRKGWFIWS